MALVEASAPTLHLGTACYYGGWAPLKQCWKTRKRCFLSTLCSSWEPEHNSEVLHTHEVCCCGHTHSFSQAAAELQSASLALTIKQATGFQSSPAEVIPTSGMQPSPRNVKKFHDQYTSSCAVWGLVFPWEVAGRGCRKGMQRRDQWETSATQAEWPRLQGFPWLLHAGDRALCAPCAKGDGAAS